MVRLNPGSSAAVRGLHSFNKRLLSARPQCRTICNSLILLKTAHGAPKGCPPKTGSLTLRNVTLLAQGHTAREKQT